MGPKGDKEYTVREVTPAGQVVFKKVKGNVDSSGALQKLVAILGGFH